MRPFAGYPLIVANRLSVVPPRRVVLQPFGRSPLEEIYEKRRNP